MGRRGPPPKPTRQKKLAGNPGKRKLKAEPVPEAGRPGRPSWLSPAAAAEWDRIVPHLEKMRILSPADEVSLAAYCQAAAELQLATEVLEEQGRYLSRHLTDRNGKVVRTVVDGIECHHVEIKQHPAMKSQRDAMARVKAFLQEFGLSPSARARLAGEGEGGEEKDDPLGPILLKMTGGAG